VRLYPGTTETAIVTSVSRCRTASRTASPLPRNSIGDYGDAAYDELVGLNVTSLVPVEEIILGSLVQIAK
jgi:hypothetical protein